MLVLVFNLYQVRNNGEYRFFRTNMCEKFLREKRTMAIVFINENKQALKRLIEMYQSNNYFT